ncbi:inorganic pyrophosphatase [Natronomonas moolapensis 8.8.11]|uniref:Inorganic pyrophosphatase n=2 Tax=Natronomonas moolapensis TaxID=416273 RepID=M1XN00_NATM8|nr:inorganic pyrophosphatase [Natronomonas moolapensis 8.8.11]
MTGPLNLVTDVEQDFENGSVPETFMGVQTIPMGSRIKYEYRQEIPGIILDRMLHSEVRYPGGYGFIPQTNAGDGDPLDVLVLLEDPLLPGTVLEVQPVGVLRMLDDGEDDDKIVAKPVDEPRLDHVESREDIPEHERAEIEEFFKTYKNLEDDPDVVTNGIGPAEEAYDIVESGAERFTEES